MHELLKRFAGRFALTVSLVVLEAAGWVLFPLVIGRAIDSVLAASTRGLYEFAVLGIATMGIAVVRRLLDSRAYARVYVTLGEEMAASAAGSSTSTRTARLGMLKEIVEFFENSLPQLINSVIRLPVRRIDADAAVLLSGVVAAARDLGEAGCGRGKGLGPNPAVITRMHVPANSAPASSMACPKALASLATALVRWQVSPS